MSTRSIIVVTGKHKYNGPQTIRLYKHSDGYPTDNLRIINEALEASTRQSNKDVFRDEDRGAINVEQLVGNIIGASTTRYGMGAHVDAYEDDPGNYPEMLMPKHLGCQSDLEWIYIVDIDKKTVSIYGGGYTGKLPQVAFKSGHTDPLKQEKCVARTLEIIRFIEAWGFKVNPSKKQRAPRSAITKAKRQLGLVGG